MMRIRVITLSRWLQAPATVASGKAPALVCVCEAAVKTVEVDLLPSALTPVLLEHCRELRQAHGQSPGLSAQPAGEVHCASVALGCAGGSVWPQPQECGVPHDFHVRN